MQQRYEYKVSHWQDLSIMAKDGWRLVTVNDGNCYWEREFVHPGMPLPPGPVAKTWYLAICEDCGSPDRRLPQPFSAEHERDTWADVHHHNTGHTVRRVTEVRNA